MKYSILGCGWLGLPLAKHLIKKNHLVKGSTTTFEKIGILNEQKIHAFQIIIENNEIIGNVDTFLKADILIIDVPFGKQKDNYSGYQSLAKKIAKSAIAKVIFISSTSVYSDTNSTVKEDENLAVNPAKQILVDLENLFLNHDGFDTCILRFSGLIGGARNPGNFFKEGRIVKNGLAPINLIHLDDCIAIIEKLSLSSLKGKVYNAAADTHPTRKDFYSLASIKKGNTPADFLTNEDYSYKIVSNEKLKHELKYTFIHPDLLQLLEY